MSLPVSPIKSSERFVLTPAEFAAAFGRSTRWAYRQIDARKVKTISKFQRLMIPRSEVDRLLKSRGRPTPP
jgi:hypothetical protein